MKSIYCVLVLSSKVPMSSNPFSQTKREARWNVKFELGAPINFCSLISLITYEFNIMINMEVEGYVYIVNLSEVSI